MILSRRTLLAAAATAALSPARAASEPDVAIIGAGAAGLAAAKELQRLGKTTIVLEARQRIGGRAFTDTSLGVPFDAGASYIHWSDHNPWVGLAKDLGVTLQDDRQTGSPFLLFASGTRVPDADRAQRRRVLEGLSRSLDRRSPALADVSIAELAAKEGLNQSESAAAAGSITRLTLGEEPERVSVADFDNLWSGRDNLVPSGYGSLVERFGRDLPVERGMPVSAIRWDGAGVELDTPRGTVRASKAIVTVPLGVLAADRLRFAPTLPLATREAIDGLSMGALTKIALKIDGDRLGFPGPADLMDVTDAKRQTSVELWPFERNLALVWVGGDYARELCNQGEAAAIDHALDVIVGMIGSDVRKHVQAGRLADWWTDPLSRGSYSIAKPGHAGARDALATPVGNRIWFAGEATAGAGAMTVGGATLDGQRAARAVVAAAGSN